MSPLVAKSLRIASGILAANLFGAIAVYFFVMAIALAAQSPITAWLFPFASYPSLVILPMTMGVIAAFFWRTLGMRLPQYLLWWFVACLVLPAGGYLAFREGIVCLIIAWPIVFVCGFAGVALGRWWFQTTRGVAHATLLPVLCVALFADARLRQDSTAVVTDRLLIHAPAAEVWKHVMAFPPIDAPPDYWLNDVGLPAPLATTCEGEFVGAARRCIFSGDLVFKEVVSEIVPARILTFDIVEQPRDPELLGHLELQRGQFELNDNGNGTTTLVGRSWYSLHMRPLWYFDWWTRDISSHVHVRVMQHIKHLSQTPL
jgi:hypothetical protein